MPLLLRQATLICLFGLLLISSTVIAQDSTAIKRAIVKAMLDFELKGLDIEADSNARAIHKALAYALHNQTDKAQALLNAIASNSGNPFSRLATDYLLKSFIANGQYQAYALLVNQLGIKTTFNEDAALFNTFPATQLTFLTDVKAIPFALKKNSYVVITALLNGKKAHLLLDTGSTFTVFTDKFAKRAGLTLQATNTPLFTVGNTQTTGSSALAKQITFGNINVENLPVKCFPTIVKGLDIDGVLGLDVLQRITYSIDFKSRLCTFKKPVLQPMDSSANLFRERVALLRVTTMENQPFYLFYDSGANGFNLTRSALDKLSGYQLGKAKTQNDGQNGTHTTERTRQISPFTFTVAGQLVTTKQATFTNRQDVIYGIPTDGITGNKPFHTGTLTIDFPNGQFIYKP